MTKKRLALVAPSLAIGGGVTSVARFLRDVALDSGRFDLKMLSLCMDSRDSASVRLLRPQTWRQGLRSEPADWEGYPCTRIGARFAELEFQRYKGNSVLAAQLADVDVIQVVAGTPAWANPVLGLGKSVSLQVATRACVERRRRDAAPRSPADWWRRAMTEITDRYDDRALQRCDAIQVENHWMYGYAQRLNGARPVDLRYAPPGVDTSLFCPVAARSYEQNPYILCVGRLSDPRKNVELLGRAFVALVDKGDRYTRLVLAGKSPPSAAFWEVIERAGMRDRVTYLAGVTEAELVALYQQAAVFALPSDEEGLGVVVLEAMSCGVPVVSTRCGGPDGIIRDGIDGYLIPLNNLELLSSHLEQLLADADLNKQMGRAARQRIEAAFSVDVTARAFLETWNRLLYEVT